MGSLMGLGKWINSWGKLYSQNALHVESAKQIFTTIPILVVEHALSLRHVFNVFALFFLVCLFTILFIYGQTPGPNWFSTFCSEWSSFNAEIIHISQLAMRRRATSSRRWHQSPRSRSHTQRRADVGSRSQAAQSATLPLQRGLGQWTQSVLASWLDRRQGDPRQMAENRKLRVNLQLLKSK